MLLCTSVKCSVNVFFFFFQGGQSAISIAQRLGYVSVVETLKIVTETTIITTTTTTTEEKYQMVAPETMQETFMSESEDEGGKARCRPGCEGGDVMVLENPVGKMLRFNKK